MLLGLRLVLCDQLVEHIGRAFMRPFGQAVFRQFHAVRFIYIQAIHKPREADSMEPNFQQPLHVSDLVQSANLHFGYVTDSGLTVTKPWTPSDITSSRYLLSGCSIIPKF